MQVVIEIPEEKYNEIHSLKFVQYGLQSEENKKFFYLLINAIQDGTPLPKGHGVLKDTSEIEQTICTLREKLIISGGMANLIRDVYLQAKTIVDADKTE